MKTEYCLRCSNPVPIYGTLCLDCTKEVEGRKSVYVVKNEQHTLFPEQIEILENRFGVYYETYPVPADGWTLSEMEEHVQYLFKNADVVVFASPIPYMLKRLSGIAAQCIDPNTGVKAYRLSDVYVFHNDNREKKELPNGKIIQTIASTGWQLV